MTQSSEVLSPPASTDASLPVSRVTEARPIFGVFRTKPLLAIYTLLLLGGVLELAPRLERYRLLRPVVATGEPATPPLVTAAIVVGEAALSEESKAIEPGGPETTRAKASRGPIAAAETVALPSPDTETKPPPVPIEDPTGHALSAFFERLDATRSGRSKSPTRVVHFGDSVVASDYVSSTLRRRLQEQFGDAGHGFTLIANAWPAYFHEGISRYATGGWLISRVVGPLASDGWHGLGGVSFRAPPHLLSRIGTAKKGTVGRKVSRFELAYVESPDGGSADIRIDGKAIAKLDTKSDTKRFRTAIFDVADGEHEFELQTTQGTSRYFGLVLERDTPGIVLDAIGIQGARIRFLDKQDDAHFAEQMKWRDPALVVYQFGANESADGYAYSMPDYYETMRAVIEQQTRALPNSSCLILGAMDRASQKGDQLQSLSIIPLIVEQQRKVAAALGCAFFDTFKAMGGNGAMPSWVKRGLGQSDLTHPSAVGAEILGNWIFRALMQVKRANDSRAPRNPPATP